MKVGTVCYATDQGLGILAKAFKDHGVTTDSFIVLHDRHHNHLEWHPGSLCAPIRQLCRQPYWTMLRDFCDSMDVMLFFETPFAWELIDYCREQKVKTIIMPMHECMPNHLPYFPNLFLCPSLLDLQWGKNFQSLMTWGPNAGKMMPEVAFLPIPVEVPWRQRTRAEAFIHNAGWGGLKGRNGTLELLQAVPMVKSKARFIIRSQKPLEVTGLDSRIDLRIGTFDHGSLLTEGDVFVFPEKFNGLSLPLQEARAAGMLVMGTDRFPMNEWLPREVRTGYSIMTFQEEPRNPLVPIPGTSTFKDEVLNPLIQPSGSRKASISPRCLEFDEAVIEPARIAEKIDEWFGRDITEYSLSGKEWAEENSWEKLKPKYLEVLENLCE